ncbi:MAG: hypothetical protein JXR90_13765 [Spirochaetes bacterium]|nr:hypothetical protein [Spirochaetota bacterium]
MINVMGNGDGGHMIMINGKWGRWSYDHDKREMGTVIKKNNKNKKNFNKI